MFSLTANEANKLSYESHNRICDEMLDKVGKAIMSAIGVGEFYAVVSINSDYIDFVIDHIQTLGYTAKVMSLSNTDKTIEINW